MARPKKNNADYHTHDKDMRNDKKIKALRKKFNHTGYSIYNMMLEVLDDCDHFQHQWDELNVELLSGDFDIDNDELKKIIEYCVLLKLFTVSDGYIYSDKHRNRFKPLLSKRKRDVNGVFDSENKQSDSENPHSIVKYSKVEESKVKNELSVGVPKNSESKKSIVVGAGAVAPGPDTAKNSFGKKNKLENPADLATVQNYFKEKMQGKWAPGRILEEAERFFNHYTANGWVQNRGKKIVNWHAAVSNWILNEVNGVYDNGGHRQGQPVQPSAQSQPKPEEKKLSAEEKAKLNRQFLEDTYKDFCCGTMGQLSKNVFSYYYNQLYKDGLLVLSDAQKQKIKQEAANDESKAKIIAVENYFNELKTAGAERIYKTDTNY